MFSLNNRLFKLFNLQVVLKAFIIKFLGQFCDIPIIAIVHKLILRYYKIMTKQIIAGGTVHKVPHDLHKALISDECALEKWEDLTPLARNEWICWIITTKKLETRKNHINRATTELKAGKRRPCCWIGCIHRTDKPISPSIQWMLNRQSKSR